MAEPIVSLTFKDSQDEFNKLFIFCFRASENLHFVNSIDRNAFQETVRLLHNIRSKMRLAKESNNIQEAKSQILRLRRLSREVINITLKPYTTNPTRNLTNG